MTEDTLDTPTIPHGHQWSNFITTLQELAAEIRQEQDALRAARNETLLDHAAQQTPAGRARLDALTEQIARTRVRLADVEETLAEAEKRGKAEPLE